MAHSLGRPNKSASVDALVDRIHSLAGEIHELSKVATSYANDVASRGQQTVSRFDDNFGNITGDVQRISQEVSQKAGEVPVVWLVVLGCALAILLLLVFCWLLAHLVQRKILPAGVDGRRQRLRMDDP